MLSLACLILRSAQRERLEGRTPVTQALLRFFPPFVGEDDGIILPIYMRARVCGIVNSEEAFRLDRRVALCRRQARVTQQLLNRAQIAAGTKEMGCKAVPQGVRGGRFGEAEKTAQRDHLALHDPRIERP